MSNNLKNNNLKNEIIHKNLLHSGYSHELSRKWQCKSVCEFHATDFVLPVFVLNDDHEKKAIASMPDVFQMGLEKLLDFLKPLVKIGLKSILLFPIIDTKGLSTLIDEKINPVIRALKVLRNVYPELLLIVDVCLCAFTDDGHCCVFDQKSQIHNSKSLEHLCDLSSAYAQAGAHIIAPSDMMDGRIGAIKKNLFEHQLSHVSVMSYSAKFASCMYGPFRDAAKSAPAVGTDRKCYQLPTGSSGLAIRAANRDAEEGADFLMVKPGIFYLDVLKEISQTHSSLPLAVYQVSGEYTMLIKAAESGIFDLKTVVLESIVSFKRAGANIIITYFTPAILGWLQSQ